MFWSTADVTQQCSRPKTKLGLSIMKELILLILGGVGGFLLHTITMKVSFKQRAIENKIKVFDSLIGTWVQMRNFIYAHHTGKPMQTVPHDVAQQFDQMYGHSQQLIGEAILVCEDDVLTGEINSLNEGLYRTEWHSLEYAKANEKIEEIKVEAMALIARMREDIKGSTRLEWRDFTHIASGLSPLRRKAQHVAPTERSTAARSRVR